MRAVSKFADGFEKSNLLRLVSDAAAVRQRRPIAEENAHSIGLYGIFRFWRNHFARRLFYG
jgi:hypothetical protein